MNILDKIRSLQKDWTKLRWLSIIIIIVNLAILIFAANLAIIAIIGCIVIGLIELWLRINGQQVITNWYVPLLPKSIDMPIAIGVPIGLIIKLVWMWTTKEQITVWWATAAIIETWIVAHLCSMERR